MFRFKNVRTNCREAALTPEKEGVVSHVLGKFYAKITIQPEGLVTGMFYAVVHYYNAF